MELKQTKEPVTPIAGAIIALERLRNLTWRWAHFEMDQTRSTPQPDRWQAITGWFLTLSYAVGSPAYAIVEARTGMFSERFDYPAEFLYLVSGIQFLCSLVLFVRYLAPWSSAILTVIAIGAIASHFRIGSPLTALPALAYTLIQAWYGIRVYRQYRANTHG